MNRILIFCCFLLFFISPAFSQNKVTPNTGDAEFDNILKNINVNAHADLKLFKKDLSVDFKIDEGKIDQLMVKYNMQPADVYMTAQVATQTGKSVDQVAETYNANKGKGWGVVAKEMGIKPGSKEFHDLKESAKGKEAKGKNKNKDKEKGGGNGKGKGKKK